MFVEHLALLGLSLVIMTLIHIAELRFESGARLETKRMRLTNLLNGDLLERVARFLFCEEHLQVCEFHPYLDGLNPSK